MFSSFKLALVLLLLVLVTILVAPFQYIFRLFDLDISRKLPQWWHRTILAIMGVRVNIHGKFSDAHPLLLVCNHVSWVDILVMGSVKEICFIAKSEISSWPIINRLAKLQGTVFIDRGNSRDAVNQADTIAARLLHGDVMVLFAEGTTGDGNRLLPFNSSLFGAAQYAIRQSHIDTMVVQPVAIAYTKLHGNDLGRRFQPYASWPGSVGLAPHLMNFLRKSAFDVDVVLGEPLSFNANTNRKKISAAANAQVKTMYGHAMRNQLN